MRHASLALLLVSGMSVAVLGCGDGGAATGMPPGSVGYGVGDDPYSNGTEPPGNWNEMPSSFNEGGACGMDETLLLSDYFLQIQLPLCRLEQTCSDPITEPPPDTPNGYSGTTRAYGTFEDIPSFCLGDVSGSGLGGLQDMCAVYEHVGHIAKSNPACEQLMLLPSGHCKARYVRCVNDLVGGGCGNYTAGRLPASCAGLEGQDDTGAAGGPNDPQPPN